MSTPQDVDDNVNDTGYIGTLNDSTSASSQTFVEMCTFDVMELLLEFFSRE